MIIAICETKEEDAESQILFWESLNSVMIQSGYEAADFAGFMADEAGANWIAIRTVYNGGPNNVLEGRERSCLFHWQQSLHKHAKKLIPKEHVNTHIEMCETWRNCQNTIEARVQATKIRDWWGKGVVPIENMRALNNWLKWWEDRILHWGNQHLIVRLFYLSIFGGFFCEVFSNNSCGFRKI